LTKSLTDQVILITGASSGFGADAARLFGRAGCIVVLAARRQDRLTALAEEIRHAGGQAFAIPLDMAEQSQIDDAVQTVLEHFGQIDILLNNAGLGRLEWLEVLDPAADIDMQIDVNLRGAIQLTRAVLPSMLTRKKGHIINMASIAGLIAAPTYSIYAATKYGLRGFTDALRRELVSTGIHVSGIYPGPASTEFGKQSGDNPVKRSMKFPKWFWMTSEYVARRTVEVALRPRRGLIIPWYYRIVIAFDTLFPGLVDWILKIAFVKRLHKITG
jgi:uncharacterized protein